MSAEPTLATYTWIINYSDYRPATDGGPTPITVKVDAAYLTLDEHLVVFKDTDHQVVFAMPAPLISTVHRDDAPVRWNPAV